MVSGQHLRLTQATSSQNGHLMLPRVKLATFQLTLRYYFGDGSQGNADGVGVVYLPCPSPSAPSSPPGAAPACSDYQTSWESVEHSGPAVAWGLSEHNHNSNMRRGHVR